MVHDSLRLPTASRHGRWRGATVRSALSHTVHAYGTVRLYRSRHAQVGLGLGPQGGRAGWPSTPRTQTVTEHFRIRMSVGFVWQRIFSFMSKQRLLVRIERVQRKVGCKWLCAPSPNGKGQSPVGRTPWEQKCPPPALRAHATAPPVWCSVLHASHHRIHSLRLAHRPCARMRTHRSDACSHCTRMHIPQYAVSAQC
jgi:hypothetical protein